MRRAGSLALGGADLAVVVGSREPDYQPRIMAALVLHINREVIHHSAEIALLRNLYRAGLR